MLEWIETSFKSHYHVERDTTWPEKLLVAGRNAVRDDKACHECTLQSKNVCKAPEGLIIMSHRDICQVDIETFVSQMHGLKAAEGHCCDFLFADEDVKVVLCDLTCSQKKYVQPFTNSSGYHEGKRATAYRQIESTIDKLMDVPEIRHHFASMSSRVGLFAERNKDTVFRDVATQNMQLMMPDYVQGSNLNTDMGHGFEFVTVLYPQTYQW